jgi:hypothetical protein
MRLAFAGGVFASAALLFAAEPLFARQALPLLGGGPGVWASTLVSFQVVLLAGYAYAHLAARLGLRRQTVAHLALLLVVSVLALPPRVPPGWAPPAGRSPVLWLVLLMLATVGPPAFVLAGSGPLLQHWFASCGRRAPADPYPLYAASNLGSLLALVSYPAVIEPSLGLVTQSRLWAAGYALLVLLTLVCAARVWWAAPPALAAPVAAAAQDSPAPRRGRHEHRCCAWTRSDAPAPGRRLRWVLLSAVPAGLLVSVTTHVSTDVVAVPLFWVLPLALYLFTFVLAFSPRASVLPRAAGRALPLVALPLALALAARATEPLALLLPLHLTGLFVAAAALHGTLARERPAAPALTEFYLWIAAGGALGGASAAVLAPVLLSRSGVVAEYPVALVAAVLLARPRPWTGGPRHGRILDVALPGALGALLAGLLLRGQAGALGGLLVGRLALFGPPALICLTFWRRPLRFALGVGAVLLAAALLYGDAANVLHAERTFFGVHRVRRVVVAETGGAAEYHVLTHGDTIHGMQRVGPAGGPRGTAATAGPEPLGYYHRAGPAGGALSALGVAGRAQPVAVVGLGAGALACYGGPGQPWVFYELDAAVARIARDPRYFTFLRDCPARSSVVLGDARLSLAAAPDRSYGAIILDAYNSDAVPVHLLTREALRLYLRKLVPGGLALFHLSNRHLDLQPVVGNLAAAEGLACLVRRDGGQDAGAPDEHRPPSRWALVAREARDLAPLAADPSWAPARPDPRAGLWTDDFASVFRVFRWL